MRSVGVQEEVRLVVTRSSTRSAVVFAAGGSPVGTRAAPTADQAMVSSVTRPVKQVTRRRGGSTRRRTGI